MTTEEWRSKSDEWRKGWRYGQGDDTVALSNHPEFVDGYRYALENPFGPCYTARATTGEWLKR